MEKRPSSFDFREKNYKAEFKWTISLNQRPPRLIFACSKQENHKSFILSKSEGMSICDDFQSSNILSDLQTDNLQIMCVDYSLCAEQLVVIGFNSGHILIIDPTKRKRGKVVWLNTRKNNYCTRPPKVCRWLNEHQFVVLFGDNSLWKFDKRLEGEDIDFIRAAPNNAKDSTAPIHFFNHPSPKANPVSFWKLQIGKIRDFQISPRSRGNLLAIITHEDLKIIDLSSNLMVKILQSYFAGFQALCWSPDGQIIVAGGEDDCVHFWSTRSWKLIGRGVGHKSWVSAICFLITSSGPVVVSAGQDGKMIIWDVEEKEEHTLESALVVEYPARELIELIEPAAEVRISEEPLQTVAMNGPNLFVLDMQGTLNMWS
jgi:WD40 repeat protein